jgi:ADP-ribosylglycohydrolase
MTAGDDRRDRFRGCLLAGAVGDALGAPIEFASIGDIRRRHGAAGIVGHVAHPALATDDTQMTLFTAEGLIRASVQRRSTGTSDASSAVFHAYLRWLHTQGSSTTPRDLDGWLVHEPVLHHRRAPGNTCLSALRGGVAGTTTEPLNDSKGCGGVMRAAPAGLVTTDPLAAFDLGCDVAALTHGHPSGWYPAGALASMVTDLLAGASLAEAAAHARSLLDGRTRSEETAAALDAGIALAARGAPTPEDLEGLGGAWVGEEALAISVCCALATDDPREALLLSVNHSGDSDSTGAICGNLLGAALGTAAIPDGWADDLDLAAVATQLADDLFTEITAPPDWGARYPGS